MTFTKILFFSMFLCVFMCSQSEAIEIRAIVHDAQNARAELLHEEANYQGDYAFVDYIYSSSNSSKTLNDEFFRIREYQITKWKQKSVVVVHKVRNPQGESNKILFEGEHDTLADAQEQIPEYFFKRCTFFRRGWEYRLNTMRIFVEEIDELPPSVEVIANTSEEIVNLFAKLNAVTILSDSVPEWYCKHIYD